MTLTINKVNLKLELYSNDIELIVYVYKQHNIKMTVLYLPAAAAAATGKRTLQGAVAKRVEQEVVEA